MTNQYWVKKPRQKIKRLIHFFSLKLVDVSSFTKKGHHQNYSEIRKQPPFAM